MKKDKALDFFKKHKNARSVFASGRVNLIGEHIDYNGGLVMPAPLSVGSTVHFAPNGKNEANISFTTSDASMTLDFARLNDYKQTKYFNYQAGALWALLASGATLEGFDALYDITVPFGAGLSSSAAIEVSTLLTQSAAVQMGAVQIALMAKKAENEFVGVNCGIMDQFVSALGKKGNALILDCNTLEYEYVPLSLEGFALLVINSNKSHDLGSGGYNLRRSECERALRLLREKNSTIANLCSPLLLASQDLSWAEGIVGDEVLYRRVRHCVSEQQRVLRAKQALIEKDVALFGSLLYASHASLKDDYEVSCDECDFIVDFCASFDGVAGARMTGGGFGGSCIALVDKNKVEDFTKKLSTAYKAAVGYDCNIYKMED